MKTQAMSAENFDMMRKDFTYLYEALKAHPMFREQKSLEKEKEFETLYQKLLVGINDWDSMIGAMSELTVFLGDGHTNIELPYEKGDLCLKIPCRWQGEKLILCENLEEIKAGAELIEVNGMTVGELAKRCAEVIPHENRFLVRSRMVEYPYRNYYVFGQMNLERLFGGGSSYEVIFLRDGELVKKRCELTAYDGFLDFQESDFIYYEICGDKGILHLDGCVYDDTYRQTLDEFARVCHEQKVREIELDLSRNMGGSSAVIDEFLKYVDVDFFRRYEMIDFSSGEPRVMTRRTDLIQNQKKELRFPKQIVCRVSNTTFSSARTFAVTLKDNGIAGILGEPTGGKPCSYGMPKKDFTLGYHIRFRVSRCLFLRPNGELDDAEALFPDDHQ